MVTAEFTIRQLAASHVVAVGASRSDSVPPAMLRAMMSPFEPARLKAMVLFHTWRPQLLALIPPPVLAARLPEMVQLTTRIGAVSTNRPPPASALLPEIVLARTSADC